MENIRSIEDIKSKIYLKTNKTPVLLFFRILFITLIVDTVVILSFIFVDFTHMESTSFFSMFSFEENIFILVLFLHLWFFLYLFANWFVDIYTITAWKITHKNWIFFKKKDTFIIEEINTIELYQTFLWRIFDYWDIWIYYNEKEFRLKNVPHPGEFIDFIEVFKIKEA